MNPSLGCPPSAPPTSAQAEREGAAPTPADGAAVRPVRTHPEPRAGTGLPWFVVSAVVHVGIFALALFSIADADTHPPRCLDFAALNVSPSSESAQEEVRETPPETPDWAELPPVLVLPPEPPDPADAEPAPSLEPLTDESEAPGVPPLVDTPPDRRVRPAKTVVATPPAPAAVPSAPPRPAAPVRASMSSPEGHVEGATPFGTNRPPAYPLEARARGIEGVVGLKLHIDREGNVVSVAVAVSSGHAILDEAARAGAQTWRFAPARRNGIAVGSVIENHDVHFVLTGGR